MATALGTAWAATKWVAARPFKPSTYAWALGASVLFAGVATAGAGAAAIAAATPVATGGASLGSLSTLVPVAEIGIGDVFQGAAQTAVEWAVMGGHFVFDGVMEHGADTLQVGLGAIGDAGGFIAETYNGIEFP